MQKILICTNNLFCIHKNIIKFLNEVYGEHNRKYWNDISCIDWDHKIRTDEKLHKAIKRNDFKILQGIDLSKSEYYFEFKIVEIPDNIEWDIDLFYEYDEPNGEYISEKHRTWN